MQETVDLLSMLTGLPPEMVPGALASALTFFVALEPLAGVPARRPSARPEEAPTSRHDHHRWHAVLPDALSRRWPDGRVTPGDLPLTPFGAAHLGQADRTGDHPR